MADRLLTELVAEILRMPTSDALTKVVQLVGDLTEQERTRMALMEAKRADLDRLIEALEASQSRPIELHVHIPPEAIQLAIPQGAIVVTVAPASVNVEPTINMPELNVTVQPQMGQTKKIVFSRGLDGELTGAEVR